MPRKTAPRRALTPRSGAKSSPRRSGVSDPRRTSNRPPTKLSEQAPPAPTDPFEQLYARGLTDGLPVIPPTRERVQAMLDASGRSADELIALVPPNFGRATVEKIAINAVMAGCRPEYLPVVIAAVEAVCDDRFDLHGVSATTNAPAPLVIVNGPIRHALDINCGAGLFGPGWRANATIGRALRLVCVNLGGAIPGVVSMSTFAHPGRYTYCIGEREEVSPWESLAVEHGFAPTDDTVALLAADAPLTIFDQRSRTALDLCATIAASMAVLEHHKMTHWGDTLLVLSPEHATIIAGDGWGKTSGDSSSSGCSGRCETWCPGSTAATACPSTCCASSPIPSTIGR